MSQFIRDVLPLAWWGQISEYFPAQNLHERRECCPAVCVWADWGLLGSRWLHFPTFQLDTNKIFLKTQDTPRILAMKGGDGIAVRKIKVRQTDRKCCSSLFLTQCDLQNVIWMENMLKSKFIHYMYGNQISRLKLIRYKCFFHILKQRPFHTLLVSHVSI